MTKMRLTVPVLLSLWAFLPSRCIQAEILAPGTYCGYFDVTRWGQKVLHLGPYHMFVSDAAARTLEKHRDNPLQVKVAKISQPINPGAGLIERITSVSQEGIACGLRLTAQLISKNAARGQGIQLRLSLHNESTRAITILPSALAIVLVMDFPYSNDDIGCKDPDEHAYWYYSHTYHSFEKGQKPLRIACREISLPWTGKDLVTHGRNIRVANMNRGYSGPITVEPKGYFEAEYVTGKELLPGNYEVFFYLASGNFSSLPGPMSDRLSFNVAERNQNVETTEQ